MRDQVVSLRIPEDLAEVAKEEAQANDLTLSQVIRKALRAYLKRDKSGE